MRFVRSVFERKLARPGSTFELDRAESAWLATRFDDPRQKYLEVAQLLKEKKGQVTDLKWLDSIEPAAEFLKAMSLCKEKFAAMGILFPAKE